MPEHRIKPAHRAISAYYATLQAMAGQGATHEGAVSTAFLTLLTEACRLPKWTVVHQQTIRAAGGRKIRPDAVIYDANHLPRGYWEAKDTRDDLDAEIRRTLAAGYPATNTIFEDTRVAV
ncbi:MAG: DNA helicase, partial [Anaerolineae bacterium]|nr:DNA helicase [Anaerolineae bacterium]